jgi:hypothetical protein
MRNSETVFLQLAAGEGSRYKMLSVIIPIAVWLDHRPIAPILKSFDFVDGFLVVRHAVVPPYYSSGTLFAGHANATRQSYRTDHNDIVKISTFASSAGLLQDHPGQLLSGPRFLGHSGSRCR